MKKLLTYFWVVVLTLIVLKAITSNIDTIIDSSKHAVDKVSTTIIDNTIEFKLNKLPLKEKYGMHINGVSSCADELKATYKTEFSDPAVSYVKSSCSDGKCELIAEFENKIPKAIELAVKENGNGYCVLKRYQVGKNYKLLRYFVEVDITKDLKEKLGIYKREYQIRLKNATAYHSSTVLGNEKIIFDYKEKLEKDIILVDDEEKYTVSFY